MADIGAHQAATARSPALGPRLVPVAQAPPGNLASQPRASRLLDALASVPHATLVHDNTLYLADERKLCESAQRNGQSSNLKEGALSRRRYLFFAHAEQVGAAVRERESDRDSVVQ